MNMKASLLIHREQVLNDGKYVMIIKVYEVRKSKKFPDGIKAKFLLQDAEAGTPRLLVDNHQPFGFHIHSKLPHDPDHREILDVKDHEEALAFFLDEVERIMKNEEN
jgi:hypothetical protein